MGVNMIRVNGGGGAASHLLLPAPDSLPQLALVAYRLKKFVQSQE